MSTSQKNSDLLYGLHDRPAPLKALFAAFQHILASFVGITTPALIIGGVLGLGSELPYLISMALFVSGVGTFIQAKRLGPVGSGLLCVQGTSFAFLSAVLAAGFIVKNRGGSSEDILAMIFGVCFFASFVEIFLSRIIHKLQHVITPVVTGIVITTIGLSLIKVGMTDIAGGFGNEEIGAAKYLIVGGVTLASIIAINRLRNPVLRLSGIMIGMLVGYITAYFMGMVNFHIPDVAIISVPMPFKYGFNFDLAAFIPVAIISVVTAIETTGDLTANSMVSKEPTQGPLYLKRIKGGVLGDGVNSCLAATFGSFPMSTFSQNNGVIQLTGVASRYVAFYIGGLFILLGLFPIIGAVLQTLPKPVLGGATLVMFGTVASAGIRILASAELDRRDLLIMAVSFGLGLGVVAVPEVTNSFSPLFKSIFGSSVTVAGLSAILMSLIIPQNMATEAEEQVSEFTVEDEQTHIA
ncbi:purine permease [Shewanella eurypsychrophilus]|uniref:Purine permease n=1 Tax=Shewanella eurypsychrophilus TaxID=2593656 RepID=A0ABX8S2W1_9GAMM|nr:MULTISPECIES: nucleobase:cation symporter-2 family protein [Shewanella]QXP44882.1 purine permease [Shewanella eurypsychrophilus]